VTQSAERLVVADAGPLIGLARIDRLDLLRRLFRQVIIPEAVAAELCMDSALSGAKVLSAASRQGWLKTVSVSGVRPELLAVVDRGEAEAITFAERKGALLLIDEATGRTAAVRCGVRVFGTGAVLIRAKETGLITEVRSDLNALLAARYRISLPLRKRILRLAGETADRGPGDEFPNT